MPLCCSLLLLVIAGIKRAAHDRYVLHWAVLALIFAGMSLDEHAEIHEMGNTFGTDSILLGSLHYGWVIIAAPLTVVVGIGYPKFLRHLPRQSSRLFLAAGVLCIGAAVGTRRPAPASEAPYRAQMRSVTP